MFRSWSVYLPLGLATVFFTSCREKEQGEVASDSVVEEQVQQSAVPELKSLSEELSQEKWQKLPDSLREALLSEESVMSGRIELIRTLSPPFEEAALEAVYRLLSEPKPTGLTDSQWRLLANEVMEVLRRNGESNERYAQEMLAIAKDVEADPVLRDYVLQHWFLALETELSSISESVPKEELFSERFSRLDSLLRNPSVQQLTLVGTSLQAAVGLAENDPEVESIIAQFLLPHLQRLLSTDAHAASDANRVSAIQVASRLGLHEFHASVRALAGDSSSALSLRISSIAALGSYRRPTDQAFLEGIISSDPQLQYAASAALKRFEGL